MTYMPNPGVSVGLLSPLQAPQWSPDAWPVSVTRPPRTGLPVPPLLPTPGCFLQGLVSRVHRATPLSQALSRCSITSVRVMFAPSFIQQILIVGKTGMFGKGKKENITHDPTIQRQPGLPFWYICYVSGMFSPKVLFHVVKN